ncbi:XopAW family type III secretion system calcium-binding effector [Pseudomonas sp. rhizo66]|uniref:XopAW family type III secretion system calcium-binding effector n=1 Tax=Pseudomonas sp. rhizo66 TaxID=3059674 RepID=UPI00288EED0E|nr:XopAW family type III secretion system calcium-binding effector [Pseudomonas sp. rhizo66]MDT3314591.1 XopAW family type III secretion system calcium-binding effector [Pseudomonas sp. rhizo66]
MIGSVSNYTSYTSTSSTSTQNARSQQLQKELFAKLDSNGDSAVDQDELQSALSQKSDDGLLVNLSKQFGDLDSDASGSLSAEEMTAMAPPPPPPRDQAPDTELADALISALDTDGDGSVTATELDSALQTSNNSTATTSTDTSAALLKVLDSDSSGGVSSDELKAALQAGRERPDEEQTASTQSTTEALNRMIANLSKQYSLEKTASVGKYLNVAT